MVRQMFRYAYGRLETEADQATIHELFAKFRDSGFRFKELLIGIVRSPEFLRGLEVKDRATRAAVNVVNSKQPAGR
jgi:hypothetical protein